MALQRGHNKAARALVATGIALFVGLIALFAYHAHIDHGPSAVVVSRHSDPILIPGIQEPEEMRVEPIAAAVLTPPERLLADAIASGAIATAGGLVFIAGTDDKRFRAFDSHTGKVLWEVKMDAEGHTNPMTYRGRNGKQYVVIVSSGVNA